MHEDEVTVPGATSLCDGHVRGRGPGTPGIQGRGPKSGDPDLRSFERTSKRRAHQTRCCTPEHGGHGKKKRRV